MTIKTIVFNNKIKDTDNKQVNLKKALIFIDKTITAKEDGEGFIGFIKKNKEFIQFIRVDEDEWNLDIPIQDVESETWTGVVWDLPGLPTRMAKKVVTAFYQEANLIQIIMRDFNAGVDPKWNDNEKILISKDFITWLEENFD
jgi:hypothetical protein